MEDLTIILCVFLKYYNLFNKSKKFYKKFKYNLEILSHNNFNFDCKIESIPLIDVAKLNYILTNEECSICLNNIKKNCTKLECGHIFHTTCLGDMTFLSCNKTCCPICRKNSKILCFIFVMRLFNH